jgi:Bacterial protein of unknown function (DUF937)
MNIMSLVMQYFGPVILNKIAGSVGINSTLAQKAIAAAAPAILAGILGRTAQPGGAKILADTIGKQDPGLLGKLGEMIGTGKQANIVEQGTSALGGLLGNSTLGSLAGALSKQAGLGIGASNTLLGLMTPAILGTLGREQKSAGLDAAGLANMLMGQKKNIADAIPADFTKLLSGTGLLDAVQGKTGTTTEHTATTATTSSATATKPATTASGATRPVTPTATGAMSGAANHHHHFSWAPWIAAIAAASALWWTVFGNKLTQPHPMATNIPAVLPPSTTLATTPLPAVVANTEAGKQILSVIDDMKGAIAGVRDIPTAQSSLVRIQDVAGRLEKVNAQAAQLAPDARKALGTYVASQQGLLRTAVTNVLALPGVSAVLKPVLDQMLGRIESLAKA